MLPFEIENRMQAIRAEVERDGIELLEVQFRRSGARGVLTFVVDKPGGVTLDDCADVNRRLGGYLDREAEAEGATTLLGGSYYLEVNSPGLDRPLKTPRDFERAKDDWVRVAWRDERGAGLAVSGRLRDVDADGIEIEDEQGKSLKISYTAMTKAHRDIRP